MRGILGPLVTLTLALGTIGLVFAAPGRGEEARPYTLAASGVATVGNSLAGGAVVSAAGVRPGDSASGSVRIGNEGDAPGRFSVAATAISDTPGAGGVKLSERVVLVIGDASGELYSGPPAGLAGLDLGTFAAGAARDYSITLVWPRGAGDNAYQGAALTLALEWTATSAGSAATPTPTPTPVKPVKPVKPGAPVKPPIAPEAPPSGEALATALGLPSARRCVGPRGLRIRLHSPTADALRSATVTAARKRIRVRRGKLAAPVRVRRPAAKRFKVTVAVKTAGGAAFKASRRYRRCR